MFVSHQKSKLFVIVNYGWILDFEVSNGQPFRPKFSVTDFLSILRIIFVSKLYLIYSILNLVSFILYSCIVYLACCIIYPLSFIMYYKLCILHPVPLIHYNISWNWYCVSLILKPFPHSLYLIMYPVCYISIYL